MSVAAKTSIFRRFGEFVAEHLKGCIILVASVFVMSIANTFFLPYVITALMNNGSLRWYDYAVSIVMTLGASAGIIWSFFELVDKKTRNTKDILLYVVKILMFAVGAATASTAYSFVIGLLGTSWYYILKSNIIAAKIAIDITSRVLNIPFTAYLLCVLGNIIMSKSTFKTGFQRYVKMLIIAAVYAVVEYLVILPLVNNTWLLALSCVLECVLFSGMIISSIVFSKVEKEDK